MVDDMKGDFRGQVEKRIQAALRDVLKSERQRLQDVTSKGEGNDAEAAAAKAVAEDVLKVEIKIKWSNIEITWPN